LQAGRELFSQRPVAEVSIASITQKAGVAKGSFYNHFDSRDALFEEVIEATIQSLLEKHQDFSPPIEEPFEQGMARLRFTFFTLLSDRNACQLLLQGGNPSQGGPIDGVMRMAIVEEMTEAVAMGSLSHLEPEIVYAAFFGVVTQAIAHLLTQEQGYDPVSGADALTQLCFSVLGLPLPSSANPK